MKCNLTDHGLGVYLIMRGPGGFDGGVVIDGMVSHSDIFPTICELLDLAPPEWLQGTSIMPLVRGEAPHVHEAIFGEVTYHAAYEPQRCIRTLRWKYIKRFDPHWRRPVLPNCDKSLSKQVRLDHGWALHEVPCVQLYDLVFDPGETRNLANDPSHADTCADLDARLTAWMTATGDPLLKGAVPLAEGCSIWPVDAESCEDSGSPGRTLYKER
jgi:arylsulfatase A-like enzyme